MVQVEKTIYRSGIFFLLSYDCISGIKLMPEGVAVIVCVFKAYILFLAEVHTRPLRMVPNKIGCVFMFVIIHLHLSKVLDLKQARI